jgi:predicted HTH transcriptional regulator
MAPIPPRSPELNQLVAEPRETLDVEVKEWLDLTSNDHRALVAKEVIALANHGGGYLIIGFEELSDGSFKPVSSSPVTLDGWSQDAIQSIVAKYVDPTIQCRVVHQANRCARCASPGTPRAGLCYLGAAV